MLMAAGTALLLAGCNQKTTVKIDEAELIHRNQDRLTQVIIYDMFSPPVASRLYVYTSLAAYEAIRFSREGAVSIAEKLNGFEKFPVPAEGRDYDFALASCKAFFDVAHNVRVFSVDSLRDYEESVFSYFRKTLDDSVYFRSVGFGEKVAAVILKRAKNDGYSISRGKPKYIGSSEPGKWRPTPPDYLDGVEWCWNTMKPMIMDSASQFIPSRPVSFSLDTVSEFYKSVREVYSIANDLTNDQMEIARYWDDNPLVLMHSGHLMFGNKKITPGGHWMGICAIASRLSGADAVESAGAYALTAIALYDGFISCWDEKYRSGLIRPVTVINEHIDAEWMPFLQTPPFPEYPSGHSTITAAAATVLTSVYGENFAFRDTSDLRYIGMERSFKSFTEAADEASISRLYGGIHYRFSIETGAEMGRKLGNLIVRKLNVNYRLGAVMDEPSVR